VKNQYLGDIGDFGKFGLLRALVGVSNQPLSLGIVWYLTHDEPYNTCGRFLTYLEQPERYRHLDSELFDALRDIVNVRQHRKRCGDRGSRAIP
jgi:hypothetical protein